jgi:hypothetical protein
MLEASVLVAYQGLLRGQGSVIAWEWEEGWAIGHLDHTVLDTRHSSTGARDQQAASASTGGSVSITSIARIGGCRYAPLGS